MASLADIYEQQHAGQKSSSYTSSVSRNAGGNVIKPLPSAKPSGVAQFTQKVGSVAKQSLNIAGTIAGSAAKFAVNTPKYVYNDIHPFLQGVASTVTGQFSHGLDNINKQRAQLDHNQQMYTQLYKSGKMSKDQYSRLLKDLGESYSSLSTDAQNIASQTDRGKVVESSIMTAADILSGGQLKLAGAGVVVGKAVSKDAITAISEQGASKLEKAVLKFPNVRANVIKTLQTEGKVAMGETTSQAVKRQAKQIAVGYLIKRPVFYQMNIEQAQDGLKHIVQGNYGAAAKDAAWLGIQMLEGGPLGATAKGYAKLTDKAKTLAYGNQSFIDAVSRRIGDGNGNQVARLIQTAQKRSPDVGKQFEEAWRVFQETSKQIYGNDVEAAADNFMRTYVGDTGKLSAADVTRDLLNHRTADTMLHDAAQVLVTQGKLDPEEARRMVVARWSAATRDTVAEAVEKAGPDPQSQMAAVEKLADNPAAAFAQNDNLMNKIRYIIEKNGGGSADAAKEIRQIDAAVLASKSFPQTLVTKLSKMGYIPVEPKNGRTVGHLDYEDTSALVTAARTGKVDIFDKEVVPQPAVAAISNALKRAGLSPEAASKEGYKKLAESFKANLDTLPFTSSFSYATKDGDQVAGSAAMLSKLENYIENKKASTLGRIVTAGHADKSAIVDVRQLTRREIKEALSSDRFTVTNSMAKDVQKSVMQAYIDVPLELRGAGDKAVDYLYKFNPAQKYYSRVQSALRYTYNPVFRTQEAIETSLLSGGLGGNRATHLASHNGIWNKSRAELNDAVQVLDDAQIFSSSLYGEAAQDQVIGRLTANITQGQKRDLAGLALDIANKRGIGLAEMAAEHPDELDDALRVVVQYPRKGILASPLARTLNIAFFPMRYNTKVTAIAAQVLSRQPPSIQKATLHSLFQFSGWLKSDEGIQWQADHADAIQVFNYLTPINSIEYTLHLLGGGPDSWGDMGQLGGLPIGVLTQIMDSQGLITLNTPYVNPATGEVIPNYIPQTTRARAGVALADVLGSLFTYPGRVLGLPGKASTIREGISHIPGMDTQKNEFLVKQYTTTNSDGSIEINDLGRERLTPLQQNMVRVLAGDPTAADDMYSASSNTDFPGYTIPSFTMGKLVESRPKIVKRTGLDSPTKDRAAKAAKAKTPKVKHTAKPLGTY